MISVRISPTIDDELGGRCAPLSFLDRVCVGKIQLTLDEARELLVDAEFNANPKAVDVGLPIRNAYTALVKQLRTKIERFNKESKT